MSYKDTLLKALDSDENFTSTASPSHAEVSSSSSVTAIRNSPTQVGKMGGRRERKRGGIKDKEEEAGGIEDPLKQQKEELMKAMSIHIYMYIDIHVVTEGI